MSSNKAINNNNNTNTNTPIVYRSKLFKNSELQDNKTQIQTQTQTQTKNKSQYKTFCKVCQDAGKLVSEYTNHNVRDRTGRTICPTLLAQECRKCFKNGHTVKYCPLLKAKPEEVKPVAKQVTKAPVMPKNVFMVFDNESDSEEEPVQDTTFPTLVSVIAQSLNHKPVLNYGKIIDQVNDPAKREEELREKAKKYAEEQEAKRQKDLIEWEKAKEAESKARDERIKARAGKKFSWADAESDSEGDEEEEVQDNSAW
jgi:hypothetical protein